MSQSQPKPMAQAVGRAVVVGAVAFVASHYVLKADGTVPLPLIGEVSSSFAVALTNAAASYAGGVIAQYVVPMLSGSDGAQAFEAASVQPLISGVSTLFLGSMIGHVDSPLMLLGFGAACEIGGTYVWNGVSPMLIPQ